MRTWLPITYKGFYDVPLIFLTHHGDQTFLFDCPFLEDVEDYADSYKVYLMPELAEVDLPEDWTTLARRSTQYLGEVSVDRVRFDETRRKAVDAGVFELIAKSRAVAG